MLHVLGIFKLDTLELLIYCILYTWRDLENRISESQNLVIKKKLVVDSQLHLSLMGIIFMQWGHKTRIRFVRSISGCLRWNEWGFVQAYPQTFHAGKGFIQCARENNWFLQIFTEQKLRLASYLFFLGTSSLSKVFVWKSLVAAARAVSQCVTSIRISMIGTWERT